MSPPPKQKRAPKQKPQKATKFVNPLIINSYSSRAQKKTEPTKQIDLAIAQFYQFRNEQSGTNARLQSDLP